MWDFPMRSHTLNIIFSGELFQKLEEASKTNYISWSAYVRQAVAEKLNREQVAAENEVIDWQRLINDRDSQKLT